MSTTNLPRRPATLAVDTPVFAHSGAKEYCRKLYFRSRLFRLLASRLITDKPAPIDLSHLLLFSDTKIGPVHRDEALALFGLTRVLRPQTIVEFGFLVGHSAFNFLLAADSYCQVFSYDIDPRSEDVARRYLGRFNNFRFIRKSQCDFSPSDIDNRRIDLCFIDASHNLRFNLKTFELIQPHLSDGAIIAVHDTGTWHKKFFRNNHHIFLGCDAARTMGRWLDEEEYQHCVDERLFVNALLQSHPDFSQIHLHSANTLRNGITLLQRKAPLVTAATGAIAVSKAPVGGE